MSGLSEFSAVEARTLTDEVKADAAALWRKLLRLYQGDAHTALGYSSWGEYCASEFDMRSSAAYRVLDAGRVVAAIEAHSPNGGTPATERVARELVPVLRDDEREAVRVWRDLHAEHGDRLTAAKVKLAVGQRLALEQRIGTVRSSDGVEWYTPTRYIEAARDVLGGIDLDPASSAHANQTVRAAKFYDAATDGLAARWSGRVYLNPPYGRQCPKFVDKALAAHADGSVEAAVLLLSAYSVDTGWFQPLWRHLLCFIAGRIHFDSPVYGHDRPSIGSVFVYLGADRARFARIFSRFGTVVERSRAAELEEAPGP